MSVCSKCKAAYDQEDAFCRKCGTPVAQEAQYTEIAPVEPTEIAPAAPVVEVTAIMTSEPTQALTTTEKSRVRAITNRLGAKVTQALQSETGKKALRGATALAVAVGVELLSQVANKPAAPAQRAKLSPPAQLADSLLKTMEEEFGPPAHDAVIEEVYVRERIYMKRVVRRPGR